MCVHACMHVSVCVCVAKPVAVELHCHATALIIILIPTPDFPHFYYMLGGNLGSLLYGDVSVMESEFNPRLPPSFG